MSVRLLDGAIGPTRLDIAEAQAAIDSSQVRILQLVEKRLYQPSQTYTPHAACLYTTIYLGAVSTLQRLDFNIELAPAEPRASGHVKASGTVPLAGVRVAQTLQPIRNVRMLCKGCV